MRNYILYSFLTPTPVTAGLSNYSPCLTGTQIINFYFELLNDRHEKSNTGLCLGTVFVLLKHLVGLYMRHRLFKFVCCCIATVIVLRANGVDTPIKTLHFFNTL